MVTKMTIEMMRLKDPGLKGHTQALHVGCIWLTKLDLNGALLPLQQQIQNTLRNFDMDGIFSKYILDCWN